MIQSLHIRNYVLIDDLEMQFSEGFTTITGETGAGKSILMGALGLILGQRVDTSVLKLKDSKCIVEGSFMVGKELKDLFGEHEVDFENPSILRREVAPGGKSRAFINDSPVHLAVMKEIGSRLVDIHSQHQNLQLSDHLYQRDIVDYLGDVQDVLTEYAEEFHHFRALEQQIRTFRTEAARLKEDLDYMQFQLTELEGAQLKEGEMEGLEAEFQRAEHAEEISQALNQGVSMLNQEGSGIMVQLREVLQKLQHIAKVYGPASDMAARMDSVYIELKDLGSELEVQAGKSDPDPQGLVRLQERIDLIYGLMQKHRVRDLEALIGLRDQLSRKVEEVTFSDEKLAALEKEQSVHREKMEKLAGIMHQKRSRAGKGMQSRIEQGLQDVGISHARFRVDVAQREEFDEYGRDEVRFLFSANRQMDLEEISRVASGGEMSRLMLCIKALVSDRTGMPTLIFDEIDAGVGGEIAEKVGNIMRRLSGGRQVLAITHLPQVASLGQEQFIVFKEDAPEASYTRIRRLDMEERVTEIARMLSGEDLTDAALSNARVLLKV